MKRNGFSFVEMLIVVTMIIVLTTGGLIYINKFNSQQKIEATKRDLVASLQMARNYAKTKQQPPDYDVTLGYVEVRLTTDGNLVVGANGVGATYFSKDITATGVTVTATDLYFDAYNGKLVNVDEGNITPIDFGSPVKIEIGSSEGIGDTKVVEIKSSGLINEN
jgi:type II secretory pathway pseudopilin PulG